jgi:hypothetical protein
MSSWCTAELVKYRPSFTLNFYPYLHSGSRKLWSRVRWHCFSYGKYAGLDMGVSAPDIYTGLDHISDFSKPFSPV